MSRTRTSFLAVAAGLALAAAGCRTTTPDPCDPCASERRGLFSRLGFGGNIPHGGSCCSGPVIGTTVSSTPITSGGFYPGGYSGTVISGPIVSGPGTSGPVISGPIGGTHIPEGYGPAMEGPTLPPSGTLPPGALPPGSLPFPGAVPPMPPGNGGGFAKPYSADPTSAGRAK